MGQLDNLFGLRRILVAGSPVLDDAGLELFSQTFDLLGGWTVALGEDENHQPTLKLTPPAGGEGDVEGPGTSVDGRIAVWSGTGGDTLADGGTTIATLVAATAAALAAAVAAAAPPIVDINTTTLTLGVTHIGKRLRFTHASGCTVTVPSATFSAEQLVHLYQGAAGQVIVTGSGVTVKLPASKLAKTAEQGAPATLAFVDATHVDMFGQLEAA